MSFHRHQLPNVRVIGASLPWQRPLDIGTPEPPVNESDAVETPALYITEELSSPSTVEQLVAHYGEIDESVSRLGAGEREDLGGGCFVARVS